MKSVQEIRQIIQNQINRHFSVNFKAPKIKVFSDPQEFFQVYSGTNKKISVENLFKYDSECSYFYDEETGTVCFKGFRRSGKKTFKKIKTQYIQVVNLLHEFIHHAQIQSGGYSSYYITDEGCDEISTFVISSDQEHNSEYWSYIIYLWAILDVQSEGQKEKYELVKEYNISKNKNKVANKWFDDFINKSKLKLNRTQFVKQLQGNEGMMDKKLVLLLNKYSQEEVANDLYILHDSYKDELENIFK